MGIDVRLPKDAECCGCTACVSSCGKNAIRMEMNTQGFYSAVVDRSKCVECGICMNVCPILNQRSTEKNEIQKVYAAINKDEEIRKKSSSGGIARALINSYKVRYPYSKVYGCILDERNCVVHYGTEKVEEFDLFYGSKYVASDIRDVFTDIKEELKAGKNILFFGTPCQVAGLVAICPKDCKDKLLTVDVICHGPGSPKVWEDYLDFIEKKKKSSIKKYVFRDKQGGWKNYSICAEFYDGSIWRDTTALRIWSVLFFLGFTQREACLPCKFANGERYSDISLGDFWGIEKVDETMVDKKGVSIVLVNSEKGQDLINEMKNVVLKEEKIEAAFLTQGNLSGGRTKNGQYEVFWRDYISKGFGYVATKYGRYNILGVIRNSIKKLLQKYKLL